jgi:outer membrane protein assembly factor BamB
VGQDAGAVAIAGVFLHHGHSGWQVILLGFRELTMMKRAAWLLAVSLICCGCGTERGGSARSADDRQNGAPEVAVDEETVESVPDEPAPTNEAADPAEPVFLDRPLGYWVEQAGRDGGPEDPRKTVQALVEALESDSPAVRVAAGDALTAMGPAAAEAVPALVAQLSHPIAWIRVAAMEALGAVGNQSVPALVEAFKDENPSVGVRAGLVLRGIGPGAIPIAEEAMKALPEDARTKVAAVIEAIRQDAAGGSDSQGTATADELAAAAAGSPAAQTADWPQFRGPNRDNLCGETGLLARWPADGPKPLWTLEGLGRGYSTVAIADGRLLTMGDRTLPDGSQSQFVIAYDLATRGELWAARVGPPHEDGGPRSTPTIDGELIYVIGTDGDLVCVEAATGEIRWRKSFADDFQGQMMSVWKFSESPLVDGDKLICTPGGKDAMLVALDKKTGDLIWKCAVPPEGEKAYGAGYSSAVVGQIAGARQVVQVYGQGVFGADAETGELLWVYHRIASTVANITTPVLRGNYVFVTTAYNVGSALLKISPDGDGYKAEEVYFTRDFQNHHGGVVLVGDYIYGGHGGNKGQPVCLELATGKMVWKADAPAKGSAGVLYADGRLIFRYDRGPVALIEAAPDEFRLTGLFSPPTDTGPAWAHPVIHDGKLYLRHSDLLLCYDLRGE